MSAAGTGDGGDRRRETAGRDGGGAGDDGAEEGGAAAAATLLGGRDVAKVGRRGCALGRSLPWSFRVPRAEGLRW